MNASQFFKLFIISYPIYIILDFVWFGILMRDTYKFYLEPIARMQNGNMTINKPIGFIVWALIVLGAIIFVLPRATHTGLMNSFLWGAAYGLLIYGVYDLTNFAVLARWPLTITLIDIAWGMTANGILLVVLKWVSSYFNNSKM